MTINRLFRDGSLELMYLTSTELQLIDPTRRARDFLSNLRDTKPTPRPDYARRFSRAEWKSLYLAARDRVSYDRDYIEFDRSQEKYYAAQGGNYSLNEMIEQYSEFYQNAQGCHLFNWVRVGRDFLIAEIKAAADMYGYPAYTVNPITGTAAALPTMDHKGSFIAETSLMCPHRHPFVMLPGQRIQRGKHRPINQSSILDVRMLEQWMGAIRHWLRTYLPHRFASWLNPDAVLHPTIFQALIRSSTFVETDFKACDAHFSLDIVNEVLLPIYDALEPNKPLLIEMWDFVQDLFRQPILMGEFCMTGLHNLLSGITPTNDFETIYDICLELGACIEAHCSPNRIITLSNGDDVGVGCPNTAIARKIMDGMIAEGELNGMAFELSKCHLSEGRLTYLRKLYKLGVGPLYYTPDGAPFLRGAYPAILTLNSIINPEKYDGNEGEDVRLGSFLQRLDNLDGNPSASMVIGLIASRVLWERPVSAQVMEQVRLKDWWTRVYGEDWCLRKSYSVNLLHKLKLLPKFISR